MVIYERQYIPDDLFMRSVTLNPPAAKQTFIFFPYSPSPRSFHVSWVVKIIDDINFASGDNMVNDAQLVRYARKTE